jgi:uncharacterized protein (DUF2141 family)
MKRLLVFGFFVALLAACAKSSPPYTDNGNPGQIKVIVFVDSNQNGVLDGNEKGSQVKTAIMQEISCPGTSQPAWQESDANGLYTFKDLKPGKYCVMIDTDRSITSKMTQEVYVSSDATATASWTASP